jgi:hypothetical protein
LFWIVTRPLGETTFTVFGDVAKEVSPGECSCSVNNSGRSRCRMHPRAQYFECFVDRRLSAKAPDAVFIDNRGWQGCRIIRR